MATRTQKIKVGAFLASAFTIAVCAVIILGSLYEKKGVRYWIEFEESVLGLGEGSYVFYLGVPIGRVDSIAATNNNRAHVEIVVDPTKATLREGVEAQIVIYSLAAGTMAISLAGGKEEALQIRPQTEIPTKISTITAVSTRLDELAQRLAKIAGIVEKGLSGLEEGKITNIVNNVDYLIADGRTFLEDSRSLIAEGSDTLRSARKTVDGVSGDIQDVKKRLATLLDNTNKLITDLRGKVGEVRVSETQAALQKTLENVASITKKMDASIQNLDSASNGALHEVDNVQHTLDRTMRDLSIALDGMTSLVQQLKDDPSSLIRGKGDIKESKP